MNKVGGIYYTDSRLDPKIWKVCLEQLKRVFDENKIVSVSLEPMSLGRNIVLKNRVRSYPTMTEQILTALEASDADYVFFLEHDILYSPTHFLFEPPRSDIYYYNIQNWRWRWGTDVVVTYDELHSLSGLCCNRELALNHYKLRMKHIEAMGLEAHRFREPRWVRRWGYEPGTKPKRRGGITDETFETWRSEYPNIDIRHKGTFSHPKTFLSEFKHLPTSWVESTIDEMPGWNLRKMFNL